MPIPTTQEKEYTLSEVKQHNSPDDAWVSIKGEVYDITDFAKKHPGGDVILLGAGKDANVLYKTYHPRGVHDAILRKLHVGTLKASTSPKDSALAESSYYDWDSDFYQTLQTRVVKRLDELKLTTRGSYEIWVKTVLLITCFWTCLFGTCYFDPNGFGIVAAIFFGFFSGCVGVCIQHDGNHGAFSSNHTANKIAGWTLDMIGASAFTWEIQHVLGHHPYTNLINVKQEEDKHSGIKSEMTNTDQESDPDVFSAFPMLRLHPTQERKWFHAYQYLYGPVLFAFMTLAKVFTQDFKVATQLRLHHLDASCRYADKKNLYRFWAMKAITTFYMVILPCYIHGSIYQGLKLFVIAHLTCGEFLATMFIVNHVIEGVSYVKKVETADRKVDLWNPQTVEGKCPMKEMSPSDEKKAEKYVPLNDWAAVQCQTSVNWSSGSWFWNHFSGGLNHQIEHHLFPSICHTNYYYFQDVVEETCKEYHVPYQTEKSLFSAYLKMISHLKNLGNFDSHPSWN